MGCFHSKDRIAASSISAPTHTWSKPEFEPHPTSVPFRSSDLPPLSNTNVPTHMSSKPAFIIAAAPVNAPTHMWRKPEFKPLETSPAVLLPDTSVPTHTPRQPAFFIAAGPVNAPPHTWRKPEFEPQQHSVEPVGYSAPVPVEDIRDIGAESQFCPLRDFQAFGNMVSSPSPMYYADLNLSYAPLSDTDEAREWLNSLAINATEIDSIASHLLEQCERLGLDEARDDRYLCLVAFDARTRVRTQAIRGLINKELRILAKDPGLINEMMHDGDMTYNEYIKKILEETFALLREELRILRTNIEKLESPGGANGLGSV